MGGDEFGGEDLGGFDGPTNDKPFDDEPFEAGVEADETEDPKNYIQQLAGKIGQSLRKYEKDIGDSDFELEKFVVNSVLSATNTGEMDAEDQKDIITKVKTSGIDNGGGDDVDVNIDAGGEEEVDVNVDEPTAEPAPEAELGVGEGLVETGDEYLQSSDEIGNFVSGIQALMRKGAEQGMEEVVGIHNNEEDTRDDLDLGLNDTPVVEPKVKPQVKPSRRSSPFSPPKRDPNKKPATDPKPKFNA